MTKSDLKVHRRVHETDGSLFVCPLCQNSFVTRDKLVRHRYKVHRMRTKEFVCKYCESTFRSPSVLYSHISTHTGQRPYKCGLCPAAFANTTGSSVHRRSHLVNGKYQCPECAMEIKELCVYKVHMRDAHAQEICTFDPIDYKEHVYIRRVTNANVDV